MLALFNFSDVKDSSPLVNCPRQSILSALNHQSSRPHAQPVCTKPVTRVQEPPSKRRKHGLVTLNNRQVSVDADPKTPLLWAIRDHVGLTGTKYGCGAGLCGACTVHINGKAERSCMTQVSAVAGKTVVTIEGLSPNSSHPLQKAWIAEEVPQCG